MEITLYTFANIKLWHVLEFNKNRWLTVAADEEKIE